jgi:hypothetical protein
MLSLRLGVALIVSVFWLTCSKVQAARSCSVFDQYSPLSDLPYMYFFNDNQSLSASWSLARLECAKIHPNSDLMVVRDEGALDLLDSMKYAWVGIFQQAGAVEPNGSWFWIDGTPDTGYVNSWLSGKPDNGAGNEGCAATSWNGRLDDGTCSYSKSFICEINGNSSNACG